MPKEAIHSQPLLTPLAILDSRLITRHGQDFPQILVQWFSLPFEDATWEDYHNFKATYPDYNLEDKVVFPEREKIFTRVSNRNKQIPSRLRDFIL